MTRFYTKVNKKDHIDYQLVVPKNQLIPYNLKSQRHEETPINRLDFYRFYQHDDGAGPS